MCKKNNTENITMKKTIAVIGATGRMGSGLSRNLAKAGHRVLLFGRDQSKVGQLVERIRLESPQADVEPLTCAKEAGWEADIIVLAVRYEDEAEVAARISEVATAKTVVSISNPFNASYDGLVTPDGTSAAEELAKLLPNSSIVKAFNTVSSEAFDLKSLNGSVIDTFVAGDDAEAVAAVEQLVKAAGFNPVHAGPLSASRTLESMMVLFAGIMMHYGYGGKAGWKILADLPVDQTQISVQSRN